LILNVHLRLGLRDIHLRLWLNYLHLGLRLADDDFGLLLLHLNFWLRLLDLNLRWPVLHGDVRAISASLLLLARRRADLRRLLLLPWLGHWLSRLLFLLTAGTLLCRQRPA